MPSRRLSQGRLYGARSNHPPGAVGSRRNDQHRPQGRSAGPTGDVGLQKHWFALPHKLRARIWRTYRPGQENDRDVSRDYLAAAREVQEWIRANYAPMQGRLI
jgi:hypothetical protein